MTLRQFPNFGWGIYGMKVALVLLALTLVVIPVAAGILFGFWEGVAVFAVLLLINVLTMDVDPRRH